MRSALSFAVAAILLLPQTSAAQDTPRFGLVMGYPAQVGVLWAVSDRVAIRPELNWSRSTFEATSSITIFSSVSTTTTIMTTTTTDTSTVGSGVSALWYLSKRDSFRAYVSPRFSYARMRTTSNPGAVSSIAPPRVVVPASTTDTSSNYGASASVGGQYALARRFGVFGEVGVAYGRATVSPDPALNPTTSRSTTVGLRSGAGVIVFFGS